MYITMATTFSTLIALKGGHVQGSLLYQCTLNQLKVSLGEGLKSSASPWTLNSPHPNGPLTITKLCLCIPMDTTYDTHIGHIPETERQK